MSAAAHVSPRHLILCAALAMSVAGCLDITATLTAEGGADLELRLPGIDATQATQVVAALKSPHLELVDQELKEGTGRFHVRTADVSTLRSALFFRDVRITRRRAGQRETLIIILQRRKPPPKGSKAEAKLDEVAFALHLTVPGAIVETNADRHEAATAHWSFKSRTLTGKGEVGMKVVYDIPPPTPAPTAAPTAAATSSGGGESTPTAGAAESTPTAAAAATPS